MRLVALLLILPAVGLACGSSADYKRSVARIEATEIATRCSSAVTASEEGKKVQVHCDVRQLTPLTGALWRVRIHVPGTGLTCASVTFDAAKYVPGSKYAQSYAGTPTSCTTK